ncbi:MAG: HIT family protein, partial [Chitinophagaceae bacterium]|nr:HIT family protein [Chitinophagaceae bacterium]
HMHMVPLNGPDDLNFTRKKLTPSPEQLKAAQEKILKYLNHY